MASKRYTSALEDILKRASTYDPALIRKAADEVHDERVAKLTNTPEADIARAPEVSKAIATALDNVKGGKSVPNLFAEAHAEVRKETIAGKNAASRSLDREIHDGANNVAKRAEVGSKIRRDIRREYT
jgi:hypothetical protein